MFSIFSGNPGVFAGWQVFPPKVDACQPVWSVYLPLFYGSVLSFGWIKHGKWHQVCMIFHLYLWVYILYFRWLPLLILVLYFILFNIGLSSYVWVITAEILPNEIRDEVIPFAILVSSVLWFLVTFFFNAMFEAFGGLYLFLFYGFTSLFFSIVSLFFLPETTGRSSEEIRQFVCN